MIHTESASDAPVRGEHSGNFLRLGQLWRNASQFSLLIAAVNDSSYRDTLIAHLQAIAPAPRIDLLSTHSPQDWLRQLEQVKTTGVNRVHVCLPISPRRPADWWHRANVLRERLADAFPAAQLLWMSDGDVDTAAHHAPDLWNWREAVFGFSATVEPPYLGSTPVPESFFDPFVGMDRAAIAERLATMVDRLKRQSSDEGSSHLWLETAYAQQRLGDWAAAQVAAQQAAQASERVGNDAANAQALALLAELQWLRGDPSGALQRLRSEVLPVFERLDDLRWKAFVMSKIADILQVRGEVEDALRIWKDEVLPVFERLDDKHSKAATMGQIADILLGLGQVDEALRIRTVEELPVYERLGDLLGKARAKGQIAEILIRRGQLDEALRLLVEEVVPAFESLGDVHSRAVTMGQIAYILQRRGQFDEAMRIHRDEQLPVFERMGDVRSTAVALFDIANLMATQGKPAMALDLLRAEVLPRFEQMALKREAEITRSWITTLSQRDEIEVGKRPEIALGKADLKRPDS